MVLDKDRSDQGLIKKLLDSGLYGAYLPKQTYNGLVLTMQGFRRDIEPLLQAVTDYLMIAGGVVSGTIKLEHAIRYKLFGIASEDQPEIANKVVYHGELTTKK